MLELRHFLKFSIVIKIFRTKIFRNLFLITFVLCLISLTIQILKYKFGILVHPALMRQFDVNQELNIATWFTSILFFIASNIQWNIANKSDKTKKYWRVLSVIFLFLSMDEVASLHEDLSTYFGFAIKASGYFYYSWVIIAIPLTITLGIWLVPFLQRLPSNVLKIFVTSAILFVSGAIGFEMIAGNMAETGGMENLNFNLLATAEEFLEMLGIILFIYGLQKYRKIAFK